MMVIDCSPLADEHCPDVYFTAGYGSAAALLRGGQWHCARWDDRILVPYVVSRLGNGKYDAVSPYGFSGMFVAPQCSSRDVAMFWRQLIRSWREQGLVSMYFRFSPLDPGSVDALRRLGELSLRQRNETVTVHVGEGLSPVWDLLKSSCRNKIRKARRLGLSCLIRPASAADLHQGSPFRTLYEQTMRRVVAPNAYFFPDAYYRALLEGMGDNLLVAHVREPNGRVIAASLVFSHRERVHYHLAGSDKAAGEGCAINLLIWTILRWAVDTGRSVVHLGGGVRPGDSLMSFKRSFGGATTPVWHGSVVIDEQGYAAQVAEHAATVGMSAEALHESGYFPAYRYGTSLI